MNDDSEDVCDLKYSIRKFHVKYVPVVQNCMTIAFKNLS